MAYTEQEFVEMAKSCGIEPYSDDYYEMVSKISKAEEQGIEPKKDWGDEKDEVFDKIAEAIGEERYSTEYNRLIWMLNLHATVKDGKVSINVPSEEDKKKIMTIIRVLCENGYIFGKE